MGFGGPKRGDLTGFDDASDEGKCRGKNKYYKSAIDAYLIVTASASEWVQKGMNRGYVWGIVLQE